MEWHDILSLLNYVGIVSERHNGGIDVTIGTAHFALGRSHGKDMAADEIRHLQAFLSEAGLSPEKVKANMSTQAQSDQVERPCIVLIDHQQARLFGLGDETADPAVPYILTPDDPDGSRRKLTHKQGNDDHDGGHAFEDDGYYERIATALKAVSQVVVFSDGKGRSNAAGYLIGYLQRHHPDIANRIVETERVDIAHLSNGEIVAAGFALLSSG